MHRLHYPEQLAAGDAGACRLESGLERLVHAGIGGTHRIVRQADGEVAVEIAEIAVECGARVEHQHIAIRKRPVARRGDDVAIAARPRTTDKVGNLVEAGRKRFHAHHAKDLAFAQPRTKLREKGVEGVAGAPRGNGDPPDLLLALDRHEASPEGCCILPGHIGQQAQKPRMVAKRHAQMGLRPA